MIDVLIIGAGPSGVSSALYLKRANINVEIIYMDKSSLNIAHKIDNYYGLPGIDGKTLYQNGIKQALDMGIPMHKEEVTSIEYEGHFVVSTNENTYKANKLVLATGAYRNVPKIKNYKDYEGKGLSYCATCDGFFYRNKIVGVIGNGNFAYHEASYLANLAKEVIIFTNGEEILNDKLNQFKVINEKIDHLSGDLKIDGAVLVNNERIDLDGLFVALGNAGSVDIARKMGIQINENNRIITNEDMMTNIPGFYAVGDTSEGMLQVAKAVYDGALCANAIIKNRNK